MESSLAKAKAAPPRAELNPSGDASCHTRHSTSRAPSLGSSLGSEAPSQRKERRQATSFVGSIAANQSSATSQEGQVQWWGCVGQSDQFEPGSGRNRRGCGEGCLPRRARAFLLHFAVFKPGAVPVESITIADLLKVASLALAQCPIQHQRSRRELGPADSIRKPPTAGFGSQPKQPRSAGDLGAMRPAPALRPSSVSRVLGPRRVASFHRYVSQQAPRSVAELLQWRPVENADDVVVNGFVRSVRSMKAHRFVALGDGSSLAPLQALVQADHAEG